MAMRGIGHLGNGLDWASSPPPTPESPLLTMDQYITATVKGF